MSEPWDSLIGCVPALFFCALRSVIPRFHASCYVRSGRINLCSFGNASLQLFLSEIVSFSSKVKSCVRKPVAQVRNVHTTVQQAARRRCVQCNFSAERVRQEERSSRGVVG